MTVHHFQINNQEFIAHPYGGVFWVSKKTLLIADVHLGKVTHFRKHGSAVPESALYENFEKLNTIIDFFSPEQLIFLGDLFHSYTNNEWLLFQNWVSTLQIEIVLIAGNHDVIAAKKYEAIGVNVLESIEKEGFYLTHHPEEKEHFYNLCGHVHPAVELKGFGKQRVKTPCFYQQPHQLILPAFGVFTGTYVITPQVGDAIYAITENEVVEVQLS